MAMPPALQLTSGLAAVLLWLLLEAFAARVLGQLLVAVARPRWLPPMEAWFSGLLAYPILLTVQVVLILAMATIALGVGTGWPVPVTPGASVGGALVASAYAYAATMVLRYAVRMSRRPDQRWFGGTIPIVFHLVLAAWLFVLGSYLVS